MPNLKKISPKKRSLSSKLAESKYYEAAIEKLHVKFSSEMSHMLYEPQPEGYSFAQLFYDKKKVAKMMAKDICSKKYVFSPVVIKEIKVEEKVRKIYGFSLFDRIMHLAIFAMIAEDMQHTFPPQVYSYVKGKSRVDAIQAFMRYVRKHRERHITPAKRGMYVYRFDIKSYGESIPVYPSSPLWDELDNLFQRTYSTELNKEEKELLTSLVRPQVSTSEGGIYENMYGIPDGAPITSLLLNLYVTSLDHYLAGIKGGFYARYGDDIIFAHENMETFTTALVQIEKILSVLQLRQNAAKSKVIFFNAAGRQKDDFVGSTVIEYLGMQLHFDGTTALKKEKMNDFMRDIRRRVRITANQLHDRPLDEQGRILCEVVNKALDPTYPLANPHSTYLLKVVNHRGQLNDLDYRIARLLLQMITGDASVKKFRSIPYKKMRNEWNLVSLEYSRNTK